jgi:hypothetical protein
MKEQQRLNRLVDVFHSSIEGYKRTEPHWLRITLIEIIRDGLWGLRHYIESETGDASWQRPHVWMSLDVVWDWTRDGQYGRPITLTLTADDLRNLQALRKYILDHVQHHLRICALSAITDQTVSMHRDGSSWSFLPTGKIPVLQQLSDGERKEFLTFLYQPRKVDGRLQDYADRPIECPGIDEFLRSPVDLSFNFDIQSANVRGVVEAAFLPLEILTETNRSYFPLEIGIRFEQDPSPAKWPVERHDQFWNSLNEMCNRQIDAERQNQKKNIVSSLVDTLLSDQELLPAVQAGLNNKLEQNGEIVVRIPTVPGHSESMYNYVRGYAWQLKGNVISNKVWPEPPQHLFPHIEEVLVVSKKRGRPVIAARRRQILTSVIHAASGFRDPIPRQKLCDAFVAELIPVPPPKGRESTPVSWQRILGCEGNKFDPTHRVIQILKRDLSRKVKA